MSTAARTFQAVRPHIPLIKFPNRVAASEGTKNVAQNVPSPISQASSSQTPSSASKPQIGSSPRGSGVDTLPARFARRPISVEEMEYIERGGPE